MISSISISRAAALKSVLFGAAVAYLLVNALNGERGLYAYLKQVHSRDIIVADLEHTRAKREAMENKVNHIRTGSLDLDLLDEEMRRSLGVMGEGEVMVITTPSE